MARLRDVLLVSVAVANISSASVLVRLSGVHGFVAASWRLVISSILTLLLFIFFDFKLNFRILDRKEKVLLLISGIALALHFGLWMMSLYHLSVAASVTIVDSYPALIALIGSKILAERYSPQQIVGAAIAIAGVFGLAHYSSSTNLAPPGGNPMLGVLLAFAGMLCVAVYFVAGKLLRRKLGTLEYTAIVYSIAALGSVAITFFAGERLTGYSGKVYLYLVALAILPMLGGHTIINYILNRMSLLAATVPVLGEPVGAALLAWLTLGEPVPLGEALWMAIVLLGIGMVLVWEEDEKP